MACSWKASFAKAMEAFKSAKYQEALYSCTEAMDLSGTPTPYYILDCRSAIYEKLGKLRDALLDAKAVIHLAPTRWQGYWRSARLFHLAGKFDQSITMADLALERLDPQDAKHRKEIALLRATAVEDRRRVTCHLGELPIELLAEIFKYVVAHDAPLVLKVASVCKHWRNVALDAPDLWQTLALSDRSPKRKTEAWLARSRGRIQVLNIRLACLHPQWSKDTLADMKWEYLRECRLEDWDVITDLEEKDQKHVIQNLEVLEIHDKLFGDSRNKLLNYPWESLHTLIVDGAIFGYLPPAPSTMRNLSIKGNTTTLVITVNEFLTSAPSMETLSFATPFVDLFPRPPTVLILENLVSLELIALPGALTLFSILQFPALRELSISQSSRPIDTVFDALTTKDLTILTIDACLVVDAQPLIDLVVSSHKLERLALRKLPNGTLNPLLEALASRGTTKSLKRLDVSGCDVQTGPLMRVVRATLSSDDPTPSTDSQADTPEAEDAILTSSLDSLKANGCSNIDAQFLPWFRERVRSFECVYMTKKAAQYKR